jgi:hypothetical protein
MYLSQKLEYSQKRRENNRYSINSFQPRFIENMYKSGGMFEYEITKGGIYKGQVDKIKQSSDLLKSQFLGHREHLRNLFFQNEDFKMNMRKEYRNVKHDLISYANNIEEEIRKGFNEQKKSNMKIKDQILEVKKGNYEISQIIRDVKERLQKIKEKIGDI